MSEQPEALRIAEWFEGGYGGCESEAAAELRRLHNVVERLLRERRINLDGGIRDTERIANLEALNAELLEALKLMVAQFTKGSAPSTVKDSEARIKAHAAIAKATGEQA